MKTTNRSFVPDLHFILKSLHLENSIDEDTNGENGVDIDRNFLDEVNGLVEQTKFLLERANKSKNALQGNTTKTEEISRIARKEERILREVIGQLRHYVKYGFGRQGSLKVGIWIREANNYVNDMKERGIYIEKRYNRGNADFELVILKYHQCII